MHWIDTLGSEIVNTKTTETSGSVEGFVIDPSEHAIVAIVAADGIIDRSDTGAVGADAVTASGAVGPRDPISEIEHRALDGACNPIGQLVLTEHGGRACSVSTGTDTRR